MLNLNKRGDVPVTVLVVLTLALVILVLVSFYVSDNKLKEKIESYPFIEELYLNINNQKFLDFEVQEEFTNEDEGIFNFQYKESR
jgi:uncharacterized protein YneF (UPF0154 family)